MRRQVVNRRQLLDLLQYSGDIAPMSTTSERRLDFEADNERIEVIWGDEHRDGSLPSLIVVDEPKQRDFFAWVTTFVPTVRPFSAYFRVVDPRLAHIMLNRPHSLAKTGPSTLPAGWIGLTLAEAMLARALSQLESPLTATHLSGTLSFCIARAVNIGLPVEVNEIAERWTSAKQIVEHQVPPYIQDLESVWRVVATLTESLPVPHLNADDSRILECCLDILRFGEVTRSRWLDLVGANENLANLIAGIGGTREDRVVVVEEILRSVMRSGPSNRALLAFALGYAASQVAPGTLDHMRLLEAGIKSLPAAALWYGFVAGINSRGDVQAYGNGLGLRAAREIRRNAVLTETPTCDIALIELTVVSNGRRATPNWLQPGGPTAEVEIAPCVTGTFRWHASANDAATTARVLEGPEARSLLARLGEISSRVDDLHREILKLTGKEQVRFRGRR